MKRILAFIFSCIFAFGCSTNKNSNSVTANLYRQNVEASYYHWKFNGRKTASGERFKNRKLTAAHRQLPFGTKVRVTNRANNRSVIVEINDRGPVKKSREIDLSKKAFMTIADNKKQGLLKVNIEVLR